MEHFYIFSSWYHSGFIKTAPKAGAANCVAGLGFIPGAPCRHCHQFEKCLLVDSDGKLEVNNADIEVNTADLEALQTITNTKIQSVDTRLDNTIGAINNTGAIGEGQSVLKCVPLGYDRINGLGVSLLVDNAGKLDIQHLTC